MFVPTNTGGGGANPAPSYLANRRDGQGHRESGDFGDFDGYFDLNIHQSHQG